MRRRMLWLSAGIISIAITLFAFLPASWLAYGLEQQTAGRVTLGDAQGSMWRGSAFIGAAASDRGAITPLLPGRFSWRLSPLLLLGRVDVNVQNAEALSQAVNIRGNWFQAQVSAAAVMLPAERLIGLGAPLNTLQPSGQIRLAWEPLQLQRFGRRVDLNGVMTLELDDMASRLSPIKPLGSYRLAFDWQGQQAQLALKTIKGPMLLSGTGSLHSGRLQFSGKAEAEAGQETRLANLLNLLGQRRQEGGKTVIALEFRQ